MNPLQRYLTMFLVFALLNCAKAQHPRDARADAALNAKADAAAHESAEHQTLGAGLWLLNAGVCAEDAQVIKALLYSENDPQLKLVEAHARRIIACNRFAAAAEKAFGGQKAAPLDLMDLSSFGMGLLAPTWEIHGNIATPSAEDVANLARSEVVLPRLVNRGGVWKVDVTPALAPTIEGVATLAATIERFASMVEDVTKSITDGKLKTVEEVKAALAPLPKFARPVRYTPDVVLSLP